MCSVGPGACRRVVIGGIREQRQRPGAGVLGFEPHGEILGDRWGTGREGRPDGSLPPPRSPAGGAGRGFLYLRPRAGPTGC